MQIANRYVKEIWWKVALVCPILLVANSSSHAAAPSHWAQIAALNNIGREGDKPFHLKMTFQLFDMAGQPSEKGTVEHWWYSARSQRTVVASKSLNFDSAVMSGPISSKTKRENYMVDQLIGQAEMPVPELKPATQNIDEAERDFGKAKLNCLMPSALDSKTSRYQTTILCVQPGADDVRIVFGSAGGDETTSRNSIGKFRDVFVAQEIEIKFLQHPAIEGKVVTLEPVEAPVATATDTSAEAQVASATEKGTLMQGGIVTGVRTQFVQPVYPPTAKAAHLSGTVLLHVIIGADGIIQDLVVIASSDDIFTEAATDAVKHWMYRPYLLNGKPTMVDTTITVNFAQGSPSPQH